VSIENTRAVLMDGRIAIGFSKDNVDDGLSRIIVF